MIRYLKFILLATLFCRATIAADPLPIDPLWKSAEFRRIVTGSFGIDSRIEPRITNDEESYLNDSAKKMADGDRDGAIQILADSSILQESPAMIFSLATLQFESGDDEAAQESFENAIEKFPNFRDAHRNLAVVLVRLERFDEALKHLVRAIELGARDGLSFGLLGYCYSLDEKFQAALDAYRIASLTQPDQQQWKLGQAQTLDALGRSAEAASIYQHLLSEDPSQLYLWRLGADAYLTLENKIDAIGNLELAHRTGSLSGNDTVMLGHLYLENDLPEEAVLRYVEALENESTPFLARIVEALELLINVSSWDNAVTLVEAIQASEATQSLINSDEADSQILSRLYRHRAVIELEKGDPEAGAKLVADWLDKEPLDGHAIIMLAQFKQDAGLREEAEMLLEQAANLPEHAAAAHLAHGKLLVAASEYSEAVVQLEQSYQLQPTESLGGYIEAVRELAD